MQPAFDFLMEMTDLPDISVLSLSGESLEFASVSLLPAGSKTRDRPDKIDSDTYRLLYAFAGTTLSRSPDVL
ncbi:hypothetical protein HED49_00850 [Ochrobactrum daejeonense]|nr:hypothetical protein [Brucella daejeonensis]